jgi:hypothetical protein
MADDLTPEPTPGRLPVRPCTLDDPHPAHGRVNGKWCPGVENDPETAATPLPARPDRPPAAQLAVLLELAEAVTALEQVNSDPRLARAIARLDGAVKVVRGSLTSGSDGR